jgi:uncharacterized protein involved in outer membrane biogenesis
MKKKEKSARKRTFWQKFWRFWLFFNSSILILILCTILAIRIFLPPERLKIVLSDFVERKTSRRLTLGDVCFNPLKGFELQDIELHPTENIDASAENFPLRSASAKRAVLSYSLKGLLHRRIVIHRILLDSPIVELFLSSTQQDTNTRKIASPPADSLTLPNMSFDVKLETAQLRNAVLHVNTATLQQKQTITL